MLPLILEHYYRTGLLSRLRKAFCPGSGNWDKWGPLVPVGNTNRDQRVCQRRRGRHPLWSRLVLPTGTKGPYFFLFLFSCFFWVISIPFQLNFVLEFKRSTNCSNININIYSFTHIKCNTKVNYIQSATKVLLNVAIFTPIIYIWSSIIVEFSYRIQDLMNNKSAHGFLNRQNPFLLYELLLHCKELWKKLDYWLITKVYKMSWNIDSIFLTFVCNLLYVFAGPTRVWIFSKM